MLTRFAIKRPVAIVVSLIALVFFGFSSLMGTPLELMPTMSFPMFLVSVVYPGAGPEEVEELVTSLLEDATSTLQGLKTTQSVSSENSSMLMLEMEYGTDMNRANNDLQKSLNQIINQFPEDASDPVVFEMSMTSTPVVQMSAEASADMDVLSYINDNIVTEFERLNGVASVSVSGGVERYIQVKLYPEKLSQYGLDISSISQAVATADFSLPAGSVEQGGRSLALRGGVRYPSPNALANMPITLRSGDIIHLKDVADIAQAERETDSISRTNGKDTVGISVTKKDSASTREVTDAVLKVVNRLNSENSGVELEVSFNQSDEIWSSLKGVIQAMAIAIVVAMVVLLFFLGDFKASLIVGTSMPISVLVTMIIMSFTGMTFNMLSLGGLSIGIGMMVDNSIVVLDSCLKRRESGGLDFREAAMEGANLVVSAVTASTITSLVVFLPIGMIQGISGQMFRDACMTIVYALTASLISALTLVPLLFCRIQPREHKGMILSRAVASMERHYAGLVRRSFNHKALVVIVAILMLVGSFCMLPAIGMEMMPSTDDGSISISITTRPGMKLEKMEDLLSRVEQIVVKQPDLDRYTLSGSTGISALSSSNATFNVYLREDRTVATADVVDALREETKNIPDCSIDISGSGVSLGGGGTDTVQDYLIGNDKAQVEDASKLIRDVMLSNPGVVNVTTSVQDGSPQVEINVDPVKAGSYGLTPMQVMSSVNMAVSGHKATNIRMNDRDYDIYVEYPTDTYQTVGDLSGLTLTSMSGAQVPLMDIATLQYSNAPQSIMRYNGQYVVTITGKTKMQDAAKISAAVQAAVLQAELPQGVDHFFGGMIETMNEEFSYIYQAMATAVFLVFMAMAIQFNSMRFSLMVMISIPFSLIGAFAGLLLTGTTINMTSLMGMILLVGIVVNNAIVLIDYTNQLRNAGMPIRDALMQAGQSRLRPILMTTLTTVLGMIPMAVGLGANAEMMRGMAMVVIGGLSASTILTLILIPTFYLMFAKKKDIDKIDKKPKKKKRWGRKKKKNSDLITPEESYQRDLPTAVEPLEVPSGREF